MNKEDLRAEFLAKMPEMIIANDKRTYTEWLEDKLISTEPVKEKCNLQNVSNRIFGAVIHTNDKTFERWLTATDEIDARMQILHKYPESACAVRELPTI